MSKHLPNKMNYTVAKTVSAICGSLSYCLLYVAKTYIWNRWLYALPLDTIPAIVAVKAAVTLINGIIAVIISVLFANALKEPLHRLKILE